MARWLARNLGHRRSAAQRSEEVTRVKSRERVLAALAHREPDHVPLDIGGTDCSGITKGAYRNLARYLGLPEQTVVCDLMQQLVCPSERLLARLRVDVRAIYPKPPASLEIEVRDAGQYTTYIDEWGIEWAMPKENGLYYDMVSHPLATAEDVAQIDAYPWPWGGDPARAVALRAEILAARQASGAAICLLLGGGGVLEMATFMRGMDNLYVDLASSPMLAEALLEHTTQWHLQYWDMVLSQVGDLVDVVCEYDDLGGQAAPIISPQMYRRYLKPRHRQVFSLIKRKTDAAIWFHTCGSVYDLLPDLLESGVDILNPVQVNAARMGDTARLKREFGQSLVFWGGGVDTQRVLSRGTPHEVQDEVRRRIDDLAPGGGYVFAPIHIIQPTVPPENIVAFFGAALRWGRYPIA